MWLKDSFGPKVFFPDSGMTTFDFPSEVGLTIICLNVDGSAATASPVLTSTSANLPGPSGLTPRFKSRFSPAFQSKKDVRSTLRIVQANATFDRDTNKPVFNNIGQAFIDISEATANVNYVTSVVQQTFGTEYVLNCYS